MGETETQLKKLIISKYGSLKTFTDKISMPWTTLDSILKRGIDKANITNILKITFELGLDTEKLALGVFEQKNSKEIQNIDAPTMSFDEDLSEEEFRIVEAYRETDTVTREMVRRCLGLFTPEETERDVDRIVEEYLKDDSTPEILAK